MYFIGCYMCPKRGINFRKSTCSAIENFTLNNNNILVCYKKEILNSCFKNALENS